MNLFVITGTTKGLGKSFYTILSRNQDNFIITINRRNVKNTSNTLNLCVDLSEMTNSDLNNFKETLTKTLAKGFNKIIFINNAFTMGKLSKIGNLCNTEILNSINTNLTSSVFLIKEFIEMTKNLDIDKRILNITSGASQNPIYGWSIYCLTKSAIEMFIKTLNIEYNDYKCFNIEPGVMDTEMQSQIRNYKNGKNYDYFRNLYKTNKLKSTDETAHTIIKEYFL